MITEAWLLHCSPSGETSAILSFFTPEQGVITAKYKGIRKLKKRVLLQPFSLLWLVLNTKNQWHYVVNIEAQACALALKKISLFAALYLNELIYYLLAEHDSCIDVYQCYQQTLTALATPMSRLSIELLLRRFEWLMLNECGHRLSAIDFLTEKSIVAQLRYQFVPGHGFKYCADNHHFSFTGTAIKKVVDGNFDNLDALKSAKIIMRQAINYLLNGRELTSRQLYLTAKKNPNSKI